MNGRTLLTDLKYELMSHLNSKTKAKGNEKHVKVLTDMLIIIIIVRPYIAHFRTAGPPNALKIMF